MTAVALAVLAAALPAPAAPGPCASTDVKVSIVSSGADGYNPVTADVPVGGTVCWTNNDGPPHTVTAENGGKPDSPALNGGGEGVYRETFTTAATIPYYCIYHGAMRGTVRVGGGGTGSPGGGTPGGGGTGGGGAPGTGTPTTPGADPPPSLASVRVIPTRACTPRSSTCRRPGARVRFSLSEPAQVRGTLERLRDRTSRVARRFAFSARAGVNRVRLPLRGLRPGRYRVSLRAVDGAGNRSLLVRSRFLLTR